MEVIKVEQHNLTIKEYKGFRVVTLKDIDQLHQREPGSAGRNFQNCKKYLLEKIDFFLLKPSDQPDFPFDKIPNRGLIIITQSGYPMLVKTFTDKISWSVQREMVNGYFQGRSVKVEKQIERQPSSVEDLIILQAQSVKELKLEVAELKAQQQQDSEKIAAIEGVKDTLDDMAEKLTAVPDSAIVNKTINELHRWTRLNHNEIFHKTYDLLKERHGIDVPRRVENERSKIQDEYHERTGRWYAEATLRQKVNGIDIMVRMNCLDQFHEIAVGWLAKEKNKSKLRLVQ